MLVRSRILSRLFLVMLAAPVLALAQDAPYVSPAQTRLRADVSYLASDLREGRAPARRGWTKPPTTSRRFSRRSA